ncbi:hypothetical protein M9H77_12925 [Catharanthus roseus]|uniref:Uncharacterized protein n=1 Tax=Catharanthus roseus TaxID=4058 RepID=A0ACC0BIT5_CATRO|nr:hypothetical protein M9H77_12925 [Catharanthus roseus]
MWEYKGVHQHIRSQYPSFQQQEKTMDREFTGVTGGADDVAALDDSREKYLVLAKEKNPKKLWRENRKAWRQSQLQLIRTFPIPVASLESPLKFRCFSSSTKRLPKVSSEHDYLFFRNSTVESLQLFKAPYWNKLLNLESPQVFNFVK